LLADPVSKTRRADSQSKGHAADDLSRGGGGGSYSFFFLVLYFHIIAITFFKL
jgi:hypothetical protein